ncbi:preprotein translocase subunit SecY [endosymbiont of Pachyrhynchus infernalis]|uniref:preprotein translocase subunit SecY n=1 Tax=endosymbiont of Pachyrhynchus infernalis TaxID=1971488 RepID=UPI0038B65175
MNNFNIFKINENLIELKNKILILLLYLIIFRIGSFIPIPNINTNIILNNMYKKQEGYIINMFNLFSGGSLKRFSIFSLGIIPYISSSIIIEILCVIFDYFKELKSNNENKYKINKYIYLCTLFLSLLQSFITIFSIPNFFYFKNNSNNVFNYNNIILQIISLTTGTTFLIWLSNKITLNGIGNGTSMIMFSGIISDIPENIINIFNQIKNGYISIYSFIFTIILLFLIINFIVFIECAQKKIIINFYKKYNYKEEILNIQYIYLPIKINILGVTPIIFTSSFMILLLLLMNYIKKILKYNFLLIIINTINPNTFIYNIIYMSIIYLFCNIYSLLMFNCKDISKNFKKIGAYIYKIRPGNQTCIYIEEIINKLSLINSFYVNIIFLIPNLMKNIINYPIISNGTSILIVTSVILDIIYKMEVIITSNKYNLILKKINIKN